MRYAYGLVLFCSIILWSSCRNDFETVPNTGNLEFSRDTVFLDTIFTNIGSSTYNLKVYNRSDDDITIPSIRLGDGENSQYRLNVDGLPGKTFNDINILANDSIFVFVETTLDIDNLPGGGFEFLYEDQIQFDTAGNQQNIALITLVKDAIFLFPEDLGNGMFETLTLGSGEDALEIEGFFLDTTELNFTNEKPYIIYGYAAVPPGEELIIDPGARVHFHNNSGLLVANTASIKANGVQSVDLDAMEGEIIFESDRLEPLFADVPGQWGTIWCTAGSTNNEFNFTTIKNASVGILMDSNDGDRTLSLRNTQIYNSSNIGLLARTGDVYGENLVINNSGLSSLVLSLGGSYTFNHCSFVNYWSNGFRSFPAVQIDNGTENENGVFSFPLTQANFNNCIIYGSENIELGLFPIDQSTPFNVSLNNTLLRFNDTNNSFEGNPLYEFNNTVVLNIDPAFQDSGANNFNIEQNISGAEAIGNSSTGAIVPIDLNGTNRATPPDAGAYQSIAFPPEG
tara:strand:+ start:18854 stop:20386 length:1533 start_codon:yes stop_codon:yes gene_type:complete